MVQSICDCSTVQSSVCLSECLANAPVFLLGATRHFVLFSCNAPINVKPEAGDPGHMWGIPFQFYCCYFESQTVVFQLLEFHLKKFKEFIIKKFYFHKQTCQQST